MLSNEKIREIVRKYFPSPAQPSRWADGVTAWERDQAKKAIREALEENTKVVYNGKPETGLCPLGDF